VTVVTLGGPGPRPTHPPKLEKRTEGARAQRRRRFSSLTLRILAPNVLALAILVGGVFYLDQYRGGLIDAKIVALQTQAEVIAGALSESALTGPAEAQDIDPIRAGGIVSRLVEPGHPTQSRLLMHPLHPDAGGDYVHNGVRRWTSQDDPEWQMLAGWVNGERTGAQCR